MVLPYVSASKSVHRPRDVCDVTTGICPKPFPALPKAIGACFLRHLLEMEMGNPRYFEDEQKWSLSWHWWQEMSRSVMSLCIEGSVDGGGDQ